MTQKVKIRLAAESRRKDGFTLIELMVVITIIGIMAVLAVGNFTAVQQQARIGFAADTLVSALREAQVLAKSGRRVDDGSGNEVLQCRAVKIVPGIDATSGLYTAQSAYIGLAQANATFGSGDSCTMLTDADWQKSEIFDSRIAVVSAGAVGDVDSSLPREYYFKPPFAQIYQKDPSGVLARVKPETVSFVIGTPGQVDAQKTLEFDLVTGSIQRK